MDVVEIMCYYNKKEKEMKITYKSDYALKTLLHLSMKYKGNSEVIKIHALSNKLDIPVKYLEAVLIILKNGGFVKSKRGKDGGYHLAMSPSKITLGKVIRFLEGPLEPIACLNEGYKDCGDLETCVIRTVFHRIAKAEADIVDNITFENMADDMSKNKKNPDYCI